MKTESSVLTPLMIQGSAFAGYAALPGVGTDSLRLTSVLSFAPIPVIAWLVESKESSGLTKEFIRQSVS